LAKFLYYVPIDSVPLPWP